MKAITLIKQSKSYDSFETKEIEIPKLKSGEVLIKVKAFGLNYADVMARLGLYPDMPKMPCVLGYDVVGEITDKAHDVDNLNIGDYVIAITEFGGYQEYSIANSIVCVVVERTMQSYEALALCTQYSTAYHCAINCVNIMKDDIVLVHAAAGGVGQAIVKIALNKGARVIGVVGSDKKVDFLNNLGVELAINHNKENFIEVLKVKNLYEKIDFIFDSIGGEITSKGFKSLNADGKMVIFGSSKLSQYNSNKLKLLYQLFMWGFYFPVNLLMKSKSILGVNMLTIAKSRPEKISNCMTGAYKLYQNGVFSNISGKNYNVKDFIQAQDDIEKGKIIGKIAIEW